MLAETTNRQTIHYLHGLDLLAQSDGTTPQYFQYDGLGSVRQLTDSAGSVSLAQTFDPYGNPYAKAGTATTTLGFTGEQTDSNGFVYLRARYYNPSAGRFLNTDPSRQEQNPYLYSGANPVLHTDPSGRCFVVVDGDTLVCVAIGVAVVAAILYAVNPQFRQSVGNLAGLCAAGVQSRVDELEREVATGVTINDILWRAAFFNALNRMQSHPLNNQNGPIGNIDIFPVPRDQPKRDPTAEPTPEPTPTGEPYFDLAFGRGEELDQFTSQFTSPPAENFREFQYLAWMMTNAQGERLSLGGTDGEKIFDGIVVATGNWHARYPQGRIKFNLYELDRALNAQSDFDYQSSDSIDIITLSELRYVRQTLGLQVDYFNFDGITNQPFDVTSKLGRIQKVMDHYSSLLYPRGGQ